MTDSTHSSPTIRSQPTHARHRRRRTRIADTQSAIKGATTELRRIDRQLTELTERLPQANGKFNMLAELRGAVDIVRADLLADAITTLDAAAIATESDLRGCHSERRGFLAIVEE